MSARLPLMLALAATLAPASAFAKSPADTRLRPAVVEAQKATSGERHTRTIKCHHESSKAATCVAYNHGAEQRRQASIGQLAANR